MVFFTTEELLSFTHNGFYSRMLQKVPHIAKMVQPAECSYKLNGRKLRN